LQRRKSTEIKNDAPRLPLIKGETGVWRRQVQTTYNTHCQPPRTQQIQAHDRAEEARGHNGSGNSGAGGSSNVSSNGVASSAGRDKGIGGGGKEGVLTWFSGGG
jgi:hypothetical protein